MLLEHPHRKIRTSNRRVEKLRRRYRAFKSRFPDRKPTNYRGRDRWTELPEAFNSSVIWARRGKDTLAVGNITGAMVFGTAFPVSIGLLLTPWRLSGDSLVAAVVALAAGALVYATLRIRGRVTGGLLLLQGLFYAGYVAYVLARL